MYVERERRSIKEWLSFRPWARHSLVLTIGGLVYISIGIAFLSVGELTERQAVALVIATDLLKIESWGVLFVMGGILALFSSRWPAFSDTWGYGVLTGLASAWAAIYILGFALGDAPKTNLTSGLIWALLAFLWWAISGLVNPERRRESRHGSN